MLTHEPHDVYVDPYFAELRRREFARLDAADHAYVDYTGGALYAERQVRAHLELLRSGILGNPHSESTASRESTAHIEAARERVLHFLDADPAEYVVVFTANASAALKLVGESYPFAHGDRLVLSADNHNSVNGLREYARRGGSDVEYIPLDDELRLVDAEARLARRAPHAPSLFAFPAQSNFSGVKHPLELVAAAQARGYDVMLDAAAFSPADALSLRVVRPEFVALSFYKIFGYPTGVGALVARRDALARLARPWFAGGTVEFASVQHDLHRLRAAHEGFEDGTPNFLSIAALAAGFDLREEVGVRRLRAHVATLAGLLLDSLQSLAHTDGTPLVRIYGPTGLAARGATIAFNVLTRSGRPIPYALVEARAREVRVSLRGGCFCNPGASEAAFAFPRNRSLRCLRASTLNGFTIDRFAECLGGDVAVGALRVSFGIASNVDDVRRVVDVVASYQDTAACVRPGDSSWPPLARSA